MSDKKNLKPLVKWSGGKLKEIKYIEKYFPKNYNLYIEPFIGGGAVYFYLNPKKSIISDLHSELIDFYKNIKNGNIDNIYNYMNEHKNEEKDYYKIRELDRNNNKLTSLENACRFFYLRKTCYRGMLRYNKKGEFNIPYGKYKTYNFEILKNKDYEKLLKNTEIYNKSFEYIFEKYNNENNFFFLDPPYDTEFNDYGYCNFGKKEHLKLFNYFKNTKNKCLMVISETKFIKDLYKDYIIDTFDKKYQFRIHSNRINTDNIDKKHLIITNY